ncbi:TlpA family protein disulfide reductase [Comamonas badia]|uniref:TlpA family protein disulfide reductase n=1 Tax=Comamonas badia TaxID=265291 RepID=UPI00041013D4|nr:TlpA disulfide reductase family protein [Comamonas badia]
MTPKLSRRDWLALLLASAPVLSLQAQFRSSPWPAGKARPGLAAQDLQGKTWDLSDLKGRVVLLNFWATWCGPCKEEMPTLQTLAEIEGDALAVLAIDVAEPVARVRRYLQATGLQLTVLRDPEGDIARAWGATVFPTTVLIDTQGRARQVVLGAVDWTGPEAARWLKTLRMPSVRRT